MIFRVKQFLYACVEAVVLLAVVVLHLPLRLHSRKTLVWGVDPIINNKYWSEAMKGAGWTSVTLMNGHYSMNARSDFDVYFEDFVPRSLAWSSLKVLMGRAGALSYLLKHACVFHTSLHGGPLGLTTLWRLEGAVLKIMNIKTVVVPYGSDGYAYSRLRDPSLRHALLLSYPDAAKKDLLIQQRIQYWSSYADCLIPAHMLDGMPRWDVVVPSILHIDTAMWKAKNSYSAADGRSGSVRVVHTPNHRGFKGTEFLVRAVEELRNEGLQIELVLLERRPNAEVRALMPETDVLAEQLVATGYALSAVEGMASGLPVLSNLDDETHMRLFRRYSFLNECPILSTTPETLKANLRSLVTNPALREALGRAGRQYVEKYHSYQAAQFTFGAVYRKLLDGEEVDLMNLFHPLRSDYSRSLPPVGHPLIENKLPQNHDARC